MPCAVGDRLVGQSILAHPKVKPEFEALKIAVAEGLAQLVEKIGRFCGEAVRQVSETEALKGLSRCAPYLRVHYATLIRDRKEERTSAAGGPIG